MSLLVKRMTEIQEASSSSADNLSMLFWAGSTTGYCEGFYVSPNRITFPQPYKGSGGSHKYPDPSQTAFPSVLSPRDIWKPLVITNTRYEGLLAPLGDVVLDQKDGFFLLSKETVTGWTSVENDLRSIMSAFSKLSVLVTLDFEVRFPWPSEYNWHTKLKSYGDAMRRMSKIRMAFVVRVAILTYYGFTLRGSKPDWLTAMLIGGWISQSLYDKVQLSTIRQEAFVSGGSVQRVGCVLTAVEDMSNAFVKEAEDLLHRFSLPLWIFYGPGVHAKVTARCAKLLCPSLEAMNRCKALATTTDGVKTLALDASQRQVSMDGRWQNIAGFGSSESSTGAGAVEGPRPDPATRQYPGQSFADFMRTEEAYAKNRVGSESTQQRIERLRREDIAKRHWPDYESKTRIYEWEQNEDKTWTRHYRSNRRASELWMQYGENTRRYNSVRDEWDLCDESDTLSLREPSVKLEHDDDDEYNFNLLLRSQARANESSAMQVDEPTRGRSRAREESPSRRGRSPSSRRTARNLSMPRSSRSRSPRPRHRSRTARQKTPPRQRSIPRLSSSNSPKRRSQGIQPRLLDPASRSAVRVHRRDNSPAIASSSGAQHADSAAVGIDSGALVLSAGVRSASGPVVPTKSAEDDDDRFGPIGLALRDALWVRYGVREAPNTYQSPPAVVEIRAAAKKLQRFPHALNHRGENVSIAQQTSLDDVMACLITGKPECIPRLLCDVSPASLLPAPYQLGYLRLAVEPNRDANGVIWYLLSSRQWIGSSMDTRDVPWILAVRDALAVNQLLRAGFISRYDAAWDLLHTGIAFRTLNICNYRLACPAPVPMLSTKSCLGLGVRNAGSVFTVEDYREYEEIRNSYLRSYRGRSAAMHGGIVWRLALDAGVSINDVLRGPSDYHDADDLIELNGMRFVDDMMSEHEIFLVCGVYRVPKMGADNYDEINMSITSWWPTPAVWEGGGSGNGYWTPASETWFQARRQAILDGNSKAKPVTNTKWRDNLRGERGMQTVMVKAAEKLAINSLPSPVA